MRGMAGGTRLIPLVAAFALVGACGTAGTPAASSAPASASAERGPSPGPASSPAAEAIDLVWFSDSSAAGAAELYAAKIQERLGVTVRVHNFWGPSVRGSANFIGEMTEVAAVEEAIVDAEVIALYANPARSVVGDRLGEACAFDIQAGRPPKVYTAADFGEYADQLRSIYDRIFELRPGKATVIRAIDAYVGVLPAWKAAGVERQCTAGWEAWTSVARSVAAEYHVPMASIYDAFNGPKHDQDPAARGLLGADGAHPSDAGSALEVATLDALGYEPVER